MSSILANQRLSGQHISAGQFDQPEAVVRWMGAIQAQDYGQAVWAIGLRTASPALAGVEQAIAAGKMLRTWPMRGTIHFVAPENAKWMLRLSRTRMMANHWHRQAQLDLNEAILERSKQLFHDALHGGRRLSRPDMLALLEAAGISTVSQRGYHILWYAAQTGLICMGPMQDKQQTFVLLDEWAPNARDLAGEEALAALAGLYFASHGPATVHDFAWWAGITVGNARAAAAAVQPALVSQTVDGKEYWLAGEPTQPPAIEPAGVHLLPGFDEYLLGYTDRSAVLPAENAQKIVPGRNGVFRPMIVVGGQVVGTWKRTVKKNALEITLVPFTPLEVPQEHLQAAAQQYSEFLGLPLSRLLVEIDE